jgi:hypothetical protein
MTVPLSQDMDIKKAGPFGASLANTLFRTGWMVYDKSFLRGDTWEKEGLRDLRTAHSDFR